MLTRLGTAARRWAAARDPHTNVYGLARTLVALGTLGTLAFSDPHSIFLPAVGVSMYPVCVGATHASLFCVAGPDNLHAARWAAVAVLAVVASGWRPRWTGVLHWWISWSLIASGLLVDGGDQVAAILALLMVPVTLSDRRRWHWQAPAAAAPSTTAGFAVRLAAWSCFSVIRLQVAFIYFQAAVGKMAVEEWRDGTAFYYWAGDPWFGMPAYLSWLAPALSSTVVVASITWGAMALETFLFTGLVMERRYRPVLLAVGVLFHGAIAVVHGLLSFVLVMWGALLLFLWPIERPLARPSALARLGRCRAASAFPRHACRPAHAESPVGPVAPAGAA